MVNAAQIQSAITSSPMILRSQTVLAITTHFWRNTSAEHYWLYPLFLFLFLLNMRTGVGSFSGMPIFFFGLRL